MIIDALLITNAEQIKAISSNEDNLKMTYEAFFIYAGMWSIGGCFGGGQDDEKDMKDFSSVWKSCAKVKLPD